jgi:hypothetical protein
MRRKRPIASRDPPAPYFKAAQLVTGGVNSFGGNKVKKLLAGLCALIFLVGSGLALADNSGKDNEGEKEEEQEQAECSPTNLSVGYADNDTLDGLPGEFLPTPWQVGGPASKSCGANCIFIGTPGPNGEFDAGALKIDNPSSTDPLVVQNVTVDIGVNPPVPGGKTLDVWTAFFPITIPPSGTLILTEDNNQFNFDTSDVPASAGPPACIQNAIIPQIHVTVGTSTQITRNFADTTQVLNTGGRDKGLCPPKQNEGSPFLKLKEVTNECECEEEDHDENGDLHGQNGGAQGKGNQN